MLPSLYDTKKLYGFITLKTNKLNVQQGLPEGISAIHYQNVAYIASTIAAKANMDVQKAYILGLLHDYGEYIEDTIPDTFHGTAGYYELLQKGYDEVAQTCLTHSFFDNNFNPDDYSYCSEEIVKAEKIIKKLELDDYDKLIQLADLMSSGKEITTVEKRIHRLTVKYNIRKDLVLLKIKSAQCLKVFFDDKCGCNIYDFFDI